MDGGQVGVISLVSWIGSLAILFGDKGMEDTGFKAGTGKGALDNTVVAAGAFNGDKPIAEIVSMEGLPDLCNGIVKPSPIMLDVGRSNERTAIEIGEEELGARFVAVEASNAKVFGTDLLDARMEFAARLTERRCGWV
jgi:hypothetical protein